MQGTCYNNPHQPEREYIMLTLKERLTIMSRQPTTKPTSIGYYNLSNLYNRLHPAKGVS